MPVVSRPGQDARRSNQARQILAHGGLDDSRPIWLVLDKVDREGELQRTVRGAVDIGVDREVESAGQYMTGIDERSFGLTRVSVADRVPDVSLRPDPDRP